MKKISTILLIISSLFVIYDIFSPLHIIFINIKLNYIFMFIVFLMFLSGIIIKILLIKNIYFKILLSILYFLILFSFQLVIIFAFFPYFDIKNNSDGSFEKIKEINKNNIYYRLYRTDGGATTSFGLVLRKENDLKIGLKIVKTIFSQYKARHANLEVSNNNQLKLVIQPCMHKENDKQKTLLFDID